MSYAAECTVPAACVGTSQYSVRVCLACFSSRALHTDLCLRQYPGLGFAYEGVL